MALTTISIDFSPLPALITALGGNRSLALVTPDGVTWTAAIVQTGQPNYLYSASASDAATAMASLLTAVSAQASTDATSATAKATAVAAAVKPNAVNPGGMSQAI